mgnify:CR=1 FL=1
MRIGRLPAALAGLFLLAALPASEINRQLFGHNGEQGAVHQKGGTLYLDEIVDLPAEAQTQLVKLMRDSSGALIIASTRRNLGRLVDYGKFREDLYYRLNVIPFYVPPLRERKADISRLATHFLQYFCSKESRETKTFDDESMQAITDYAWPGNVRELKNLIERLAIMTPGNTITRSQLPQAISNGRHNGAKDQSSINLRSNTFRTAKEEFEKEFLIQKLEENDWNISRTAEAVEIERSNLHRKIKAYGIELKK